MSEKQLLTRRMDGGYEAVVVIVAHSVENALKINEKC